MLGTIQTDNNRNDILKVMGVPNAHREEVRHEELKQLNQGCMKNTVNFTGPKRDLIALIARQRHTSSGSSEQLFSIS